MDRDESEAAARCEREVSSQTRSENLDRDESEAAARCEREVSSQTRSENLDRDEAVPCWGAAQRWEPPLREAAAPITEDPARVDRLVDDVWASFAYAEWVAASATDR